jgi:hypothetical protein
MAQFPKSQAEILYLCNTMIAGYTANPLIFPNNLPLDVTAKRDLFQAKQDAQIAALAAAQSATTQKEDILDVLKQLMRDQLKISEVDTGNDPDKLALIGWGPRAEPIPELAPGQPRILEVVSQVYDAVALDWKGPTAGTGGQVRTYIIERQATPGPNWDVVGYSIDSQVALINQPRGTDLKYRVKAVNLGGESVPSNEVDVFL